MPDQLTEIQAALARIEAHLAPKPDKTEALFAKLEDRLGDPLPGVDPKDWAKLGRVVKRVNKARKRLT